MNVKDTIKSVQDALNEAHEDGPSQALDRAHLALWDGLLRHAHKLGLSNADLRDIAGRGNVQTFGGGTGKTPAPTDP